MAKHNFFFGGIEVRPRGVVACFGEFLRLIYYFLPEGAEAPAAMWSEDARLCVVFLPTDAMPAFVDLPCTSRSVKRKKAAGSSGARQHGDPGCGEARPLSSGRASLRSPVEPRPDEGYSFLIVAVERRVMVPGSVPLENRLRTGPMNRNV
jgi:hypothetical protein